MAGRERCFSLPMVIRHRTPRTGQLPGPILWALKQQGRIGCCGQSGGVALSGDGVDCACRIRSIINLGASSISLYISLSMSPIDFIPTPMTKLAPAV